MSTSSAKGHGGRDGTVRGPTEGLVASEFAEIDVRIDTEGNGDRLRVEDLRTGHVRFLDALELETIVWLPDGHLYELLDPSAGRWGNTGAP